MSITSSEVILRLQPAPGAALPLPALPLHAVSRRARYRVDTTALQMPVSLHLGHIVVDGRLLDLSAGGCCVDLAHPFPSALHPGITVTVLLPAERDQTYMCPAEIRAMDRHDAAVRLHVRFCTLAPEARRALLTWIGALAMRVAQPL